MPTQRAFCALLSTASGQAGRQIKSCKGFPGIYVCATCWGTKGFALWHNAKFPANPTEAVASGNPA